MNLSTTATNILTSTSIMFEMILAKKKLWHEYIPTSEMVADMLTKALGRIKLEKLRSMCGISMKGEIAEAVSKGEC